MASLSDDKAETIELHESSMLSHVDDDVTLLRGARNPSANFMKYLLIFGVAFFAILSLVLLMAFLHRIVIVRGVDIRKTNDEIRAWQDQFLQIPRAATCESFFKYYTSMPHYPASAGAAAMTKWTRERFEQYGFRTEVFSYEVPVPLPLHINFSIIAPNAFTWENNSEPEFTGDKFSSASESHFAIPEGFNAWSANGSVEAEVVYVNYATYDDFETLDSLGIQLEGKIALARYGKIFRGTKAMLAQERGMVALVLYSDLADDGSRRGGTYPDGPWRPPGSLERGSAQFGSLYAGDPYTPFNASIPGKAYRLPRDRTNLPTIPVMPISAAKASEVLRRLRSAEENFTLPEGWQGGDSFPYHIGPGPVVVNVTVLMSEKLHEIQNVVGTIDGSTEPEKWVILGNHRDAWIWGAVDPASGSAPLMEIARSFSDLLKRGWKPRRTIKLASWDAEELGLFGSTEWAEQFAAQLNEKVVAYMNVDNTGTGQNFRASATPSLQSVIKRAAKRVAHPAAPNATVYSQWMWRSRAESPMRSALVSPPVYPLGSGSDYVAFCHHLGIPSMDLRFTGTYGVYHSVFDNYNYYQIVDPEFAMMVTVTKLWGLIAMELADSVFVPLEFEEYALEMHEQLRQWQQSEPTLDFSALLSAIETFSRAAVYLSDSIQSLDLTALKMEDAKKINSKLNQIERKFLRDEGLRGRSWWKHPLFATPIYGGYEGVMYPDLVHLLRYTQRNALTLSEAQEEINQLAAEIRRAAAFAATE